VFEHQGACARTAAFAVAVHGHGFNHDGFTVQA
jgi:hypothetical protein